MSASRLLRHKRLRNYNLGLSVLPEPGSDGQYDHTMNMQVEYDGHAGLGLMQIMTRVHQARSCPTLSLQNLCAVIFMISSHQSVPGHAATAEKP